MRDVETVRAALEMPAARRAYDADMGASEYEAFLNDRDVRALAALDRLAGRAADAEKALAERLVLLRRFEYLQYGATLEGEQFARHVCPVCGWPKEGHGGPGRYKGNAANTHEQGCSMDEVLHGRPAPRIAAEVAAFSLLPEAVQAGEQP